MRIDEIDKTKLSPMMLEYVNLKEKYMDTIIFYRLGDFYEMFFEDAYLASRELELTLTGKNAGLEERVPMCGIPHHAYSQYVEKLIEKGYKVAICEQLTDPKESKGLVERNVIQVVSRGTILDSSLDEHSNNYIGSIYNFGYSYSLSFSDISTGEINSILLDDNNSLIREIVNKGIKEVIVNSNIDRELLYILKENYNILVTIRDELEENDYYKYIYEDENDIRIITGIKHLLSYIISMKKSDLIHLKKVNKININDSLIFDIHTKKNLELTETIRDNDRRFSLLWLLDKTKTAMGSRYLKRQIESPLRDKKALERRYDIINKLLTEFIHKEELEKLLDQVYDLERLSGRISYGNANGRDLTQLKKSIGVLPEIKRILKEIDYDKEINDFVDLFEILEKSINEDSPISIKEGDLIKEGYNSELDELKSVRRNSKDYILEIENREKERTGIKNLKIGYNKVFGYYIEISKGQVKDIKDEYGYIRKQTLTTGERFITDELKEKEAIILGADDKIIKLEYNLFCEIRDICKKYISELQNTSLILAELDMLVSFSTVTELNKYVRPTLSDDNIIKIVEGRHPVVEKVSKNNYVPNDINMDKNTNVLLITGPNMAGKSTYMRQLAIIVIMAQIGCFVPCTSCIVPIFDKIFTRIGASDDLVSGESTFMVEMKEANAALQNATKNSLILFDELGRGTATYDGMSLAEAILEYIHNNIGCKTLFSTHYHELTKLSDNLNKLKNVHVSAEESEGKLTFLHKVKSGSIDKSYGINVASLANLPKEVIERAEEVLEHFEKNKENKTNKYTQTELIFDTIEEDKEENQVIKRLEEIDPLSITPIDALNILYELKKEINNGKGI